jgi:hypothetical protein
VGKKDLAGAVPPSIEERHEWQSFLGLLPALDVSAVDPVLHQRCLAASWQLRGRSRISRSGLLRASGLEFQGSSLEFDLLLASLFRNEVLEPIVSSPFCFRVFVGNWTDPGPHTRLMSARPCLAPFSRNSQSGSGFSTLDHCLRRPTLRQRARAIRAEIPRLHQMYGATWLEPANAVGGRCAGAIRNSIEQSMEPVRQQLELPLGEQENSDLEGDERCNK